MEFSNSDLGEATSAQCTREGGLFTSAERKRLEAHQGDILEVLPTCSFLTAQIEDKQKRVVDVEFCGGEYLLYDEDDVEFLKSTYRTWISTKNIQHPSDPYPLMPEQVQVLHEHGLIRVRELKNALPTGKDKRRVMVKDKTEISEEELRRRASVAVRGRKAKALKRKANGEFANAAMNRVKPADIEKMEVSEEEVQVTMEELRTKLEREASEKMYYRVPIYSTNDSDYEIIESPRFPATEEYRLRLVVYRDLWRKGFYITDGFKFGCAYLAYEGKPGEKHSRYMVRCIASHDSISPTSLISLSRVASQVKKTILVAIVSSDSFSPYYMQMNWWRVK